MKNLHEEKISSLVYSPQDQTYPLIHIYSKKIFYLLKFDWIQKKKLFFITFDFIFTWEFPFFLSIFPFICNLKHECVLMLRWPRGLDVFSLCFQGNFFTFLFTEWKVNFNSKCKLKNRMKWKICQIYFRSRNGVRVA